MYFKDLHFVVHECLSVNPFWLEMQNIILLHVMFQLDHLEKELIYVRFSQLFIFCLFFIFFCSTELRHFDFFLLYWNEF